jgi:AraC-like DNA-binding protein
MQFDAIHFSRDRRHSANGESDVIGLQWYRQGAIQGRLDDGTSLRIAPDRLVVQDFAHAYAGIGRSDDHMGVAIPRHLLKQRDRLYERFPVVSCGVRSPQGRVLANALEELWRGLTEETVRDDVQSMVNPIILLLDALLAEHPSPEAAREIEPSVLSAMQAFLLANLQKPDLKAADLCRAFRCSRATVYRLFKGEGGVNNYIRSQRLDRCFQDLASSAVSGRKRVWKTVEPWGFHDASHFNRLFKARFGYAPSELLMPDRAPPAEHAAKPPPKLPIDGVGHIRGWLESM